MDLNQASTEKYQAWAERQQARLDGNADLNGAALGKCRHPDWPGHDKDSYDRAFARQNGPAPTAPTAPTVEPFFDALGHRIATLNALLSDAENTLSDLRDRMFGSSKLANGIGANAPKDAGSATDVVLFVLDGLITQARVVLDHTQVLNSRL